MTVKSHKNMTIDEVFKNSCFAFGISFLTYCTAAFLGRLFIVLLKYPDFIYRDKDFIPESVMRILISGTISIIFGYYLYKSTFFKKSHLLFCIISGSILGFGIGSLL